MSKRTELSVLQNIVYNVEQIKELLDTYRDTSLDYKYMRSSIFFRFEVIYSQLNKLPEVKAYFPDEKVESLQKFTEYEYDISDIYDNDETEVMELAKWLTETLYKAIKPIVGEIDTSVPPLVGYAPSSSLSEINNLGWLGKKIVEHINEIEEELKAAGYSNIRIYGSVARGAETLKSDIDFLVEAPTSKQSSKHVYETETKIEEILDIHNEVQILFDNRIFGHVAENIKEDAVRLTS